MHKRKFVYIVPCVVVLCAVIFLLPERIGQSSGEKELYGGVPVYYGRTSSVVSGQSGSLMGGVPSAKVTAVPVAKTKTRASGLSHGKAARKAAQKYKETQMTSGDGMMVMITSSAQKHTQNSSAAGGNTYRGIRSASTSGTGVTTTQGIAMVSGYGFGNSGVRQQPAGIGVVRRGLSGTGDPSGGRDDNGIWSEWLDEYVEYWLGLSENAGKTEDDVTGDYLQTWWEDNYGDDFMPDLGWTDWAQQWFLSPVGDAWGVLALFIVGYVLCLKLRIAKRKGEEK